MVHSQFDCCIGEAEVFKKMIQSLRRFVQRLTYLSYLLTGTNRNDCLKILDVLTDHAPLDKTADVFFYKFWEYIKSNDSVHAVGNKQTLDSVTCKILNTKEDVNVNLANTFDDSPLIYFCRLGCLQSIRMLLVHKADVDHQGKRRMTALHHITYLTGKNLQNYFEYLKVRYQKLPKSEGNSNTQSP